MRSAKYYLPMVLGLAMAGATADQLHAQGAPVTAAPAVSVDPSQFLAQSPNGGGTLVSQIRNLLVADKASLQTIMGLLPGANADQQASVADGLSQAAKIYVRTDPVFAGQIQQAVVASGFPELIKAYTSLSGDTGTAATGGGGGGGAGGGGGGPTQSTASNGGTTGAPQSFGTNSTPTAGTNLFTGATASTANFSSASGSGL